MKIALKSICFLTLTLSSTIGLYAQSQKGIDIDGEFSNDYSGSSVSMPDANTIAIGAPNNDGIGSDAGHVRIFGWNGSQWIQKGADIDGESASDMSGYSVSMPDPNTVAIGTPYNDANGINSGHVRIFSWNGSSWVQKGTDIDGPFASEKFGSSIDMPDEDNIVIGVPNGNGNVGETYVYTWTGSTWIMKGNKIFGEGASNYSGCSVNMPDVNTIAIGAIGNTGTNGVAGHARVFMWNGSGWIQKGADIDGESAYDKFGQSVYMPNANTIAIGGPENDNSNGVDAGYVRIFDWDGSAWTQRGIDINGTSPGNGLGSSICMPDVNTIAVGSPYYSSEAGQVQLFSWNGSSWIQTSSINGEANADYCGISVSMPDINTIAIGASQNSDYAYRAGHVRVFSINSTTGINETYNNGEITIYPNPASFVINVEMENASSIRLLDVSGKLLEELYGQSIYTIDVTDLTPGMYMIETDNGQTVKFIKE